MTTQLSGHLGNSIKRPANLIPDHFEADRAGGAYVVNLLKSYLEFDCEFFQNKCAECAQNPEGKMR